MKKATLIVRSIAAGVSPTKRRATRGPSMAPATGHIESAHTHDSGLKQMLGEQREEDEQATTYAGTPCFHRQETEDRGTGPHVAHAMPKLLPTVVGPACR